MGQDKNFISHIINRRQDHVVIERLNISLGLSSTVMLMVLFSSIYPDFEAPYAVGHHYAVHHKASQIEKRVNQLAHTILTAV